MGEQPVPAIPAALEDAVGFNLYRVGLLFRRELMVALKDYALTPEQWQVLAALWATPRDVHQQDLCTLTLKDKHAMSRMLVRMERDGWVRRRKDPGDGRAVFVRATSRATQRADAIRKQLFAHFDPILAALSQEDTAHLLRSLSTFRAVLEPRQEAPWPPQARFP